MDTLISGPFMYLAVVVFVLASAKKVWGIFQMPRHLRWDLYPVAHDGPEGSPFQRLDFWKEKRHVDVPRELAEMAEEIFLLKRTFLYNKKIWNFSYPLHLGMYLVIGWMVLIVLQAVLQAFVGVEFASTATWISLLQGITVIVGLVGLLAGAYGALGLLYIRYTDENLKDFSPPVTFLNLYLLLAMFVVGLYAWFSVDMSFRLAREYVASLLILKPVAVPGVMTLEILLLGIFLIYLPFSRMFHFAAKYFFYHNIMWEDEPVTKGSDLEKAITDSLGYEMKWSASHVVQDGNWLKQATTNPTAEVKKSETQSQNERHGQEG